MDDVKKEADRLFEDDEFTKAYKLYAQLVSNFPKDPEYNYRLGVCMIYSEPDKKRCIPYLKLAANNPKDAPKDVNFYLGKAYHINYLFDEAIKYYTEYKKTGSAAQQKKLQVDREIKACNYGKHLLSNLSDLVVQNKKQLNEADYFRSYDLKSMGGKLLVKPEEFRTPTDKKKKEKSVMFLPKGSNVVYFSSYGDNTVNGKDLYTAARLPNGTYSKPEKVKGINTEFDEDYPFLHPDGKTLYFASKGYNSMGGYDIFKSTYNEETNTWTAPVNLEFPINSPDDDYLFVTDSLEKTAYFSTGRQSPPGKIDVLKINTERKPIDVLVIKGNVVNPGQSLKSIVTVKDAATDAQVGTFSATEKGDYNMALPNGANLVFTVETPGLETQSDKVALPMATTSKPYKQTIAYEKGILKIINNFDEAASDEDYLQYLKVIEEKAKLEVNEGKNKLSITPEVAANTNNSPKEPQEAVATVPKSSSENSAPEITGEVTAVPTTNNTPAPKPAVVLDNKQLAGMARQDAAESQQEAVQLDKDARDALEVGQKQKATADAKLAEAETAIKAAENLTAEDEKKTALEKANALKTSALADQVIANKITGFAGSLGNDAKNKRKEADLNTQYAKELEKTPNPKVGNSGPSIAKLESLQKQIAEISGQKAVSADVMDALKTEIEDKEKQLAAAEKTNSDVKTNLDDIKTAISSKETELSAARKKAAKQELTAQIATLKTEQGEKEKQLAGQETEIKKMNEELAGLKNEQDLANKIKTEDIALATSSPAINNTGTAIEVTEPAPVTNAAAEQKTSVASLQDKYRDKIAIADPKNVNGIEESTTQLRSFNKEIDQALTFNKATLLKTKNAAEKQKINTEIKKLETAKKQNQQFIASNNKLVAGLNRPQPVVAAKPAGFNPVSAASPAEAVTQLNNLAAQLDVNENDNFDFNAYQNPQAQSLKVEADSRINDAIARQKKLKDIIAASKTEIQKAPAGNAPVLSFAQLNKDAEENQTKAQALRTTANTKTGDEKDRLLNEAKALDEKVNTDYIEAAKITRTDNTAAFNTNNENIEALISDNKAAPPELAEAKKLNDEAKTAFKQAETIRQEAETLGNSGARLGSISNAEEKEAEAILKQQQAVETLKKSNPAFVLKTPVKTSEVTGTLNSVTDLNTQVDAVNKDLADLVAIKIESYQKLYDANSAELEQLSGDIKNKQAALDNTPSLKTDYIAGNNKAENAKNLKTQADAATTQNDKLNTLIAAIKKQNEAVKQSSALNTSLEKITLTTPRPAEPAVATNTPTATVTNEKAEEPATAANTQAVTVANEGTGEPAVVTDQNKITPPSATVSESNAEILETLDKKDTTAAQVLDYFNVNAPALKNRQAGRLVQNSLAQLKSTGSEIKDLDAQVNTYAGGNTPAGNPAELKVKADNLLTEADQLDTKATETKAEANTKTGDEKNSLLAKAKELGEASQNKMAEAAVLNQKANESDFQANDKAIVDMLGKLKTDNATLHNELEQKSNELKGLKTQAKELRNEANALANNAARLGAISNAEEKELELLQKQNQLITELKKQYPAYVVQPAAEITASNNEVPAALVQKRKAAVEKQFSELTNLTNAFSLEYESSKNSVPKNLNAAQQTNRQKADALNAESKRLLIRSAQEKNETERTRMLTLAAKSGHAAVEELNKLLPAKTDAPAPAVVQNDSDALNNIGNNINAANNNQTAPPAANPPRNPANARGAVRIEGLEVIRGNAYNANKPIPLNSKIEDGLVFRVQIGAFKVLLPNDAFKGLSPLNAETTPTGYYRYTAGNFNKFENANAVKNDLRGLGYSDAFVVCYYNGKRISVSEALALLDKEGKTVDIMNAPQTAGITANANVPKVTPVQTVIQDPVTVTKNLEQINGLLYTIQIGVYGKVSRLALLNLRPVFTENIPGGLFRYTAGIYNNTEKLIADKRKIVDLGIKDAFVTAYLNGKRISFSDAKARQESDAGIKMEPENPVVFDGVTAVPIVNLPAAVTQPAAPQANTAPQTTVQPFSNGVSTYPAATSENGVKNTEEGVSFKVQIGAYSKQVPDDVADKFSAIKNWPVENKQINALFIYNIGNFSEARFAKDLRDEAIRLGLADAFITVYKDGKKVYGAEATQYINR